MNRLFIFFIVLTVGCATKDKLTESTNDSTDSEFADLRESEKLRVFSQLGEELKGDYRRYLGQNEDSTKVRLTLNKDNRFAIGFKPFFKTESSDSLVTFEFATTSEFKNMCVGRWTDEGKMVKLNFLLGQSEFFDSLRNDGVIKIIDDKTVLLDKDAKGVWIARALCVRR